MRFLRIAVLAAVLSACSESGEVTPEVAVDYAANATRLVAEELQPSSLSEAEQLAELAWFTRAAEPFRGIEMAQQHG